MSLALSSMMKIPFDILLIWMMLYCRQSESRTFSTTAHQSLCRAMIGLQPLQRVTVTSSSKTSNKSNIVRVGGINPLQVVGYASPSPQTVVAPTAVMITTSSIVTTRTRTVSTKPPTTKSLPSTTKKTSTTTTSQTRKFRFRGFVAFQPPKRIRPTTKSTKTTTSYTVPRSQFVPRWKRLPKPSSTLPSPATLPVVTLLSRSSHPSPKSVTVASKSQQAIHYAKALSTTKTTPTISPTTTSYTRRFRFTGFTAFQPPKVVPMTTTKPTRIQSKITRTNSVIRRGQFIQPLRGLLRPTRIKPSRKETTVTTRSFKRQASADPITVAPKGSLTPRVKNQLGTVKAVSNPRATTLHQPSTKPRQTNIPNPVFTQLRTSTVSTTLAQASRKADFRNTVEHAGTLEKTRKNDSAVHISYENTMGASVTTSETNTTLYATFLRETKNPVVKVQLIYGLCGYPTYYDAERCQALFDTSSPLKNCEREGGMKIFAVLVFLLGLIIIVGNSLLPITVWRCLSMRKKHNYIKVSLAMADMITGFILLGSVLPSMIWFRNLSHKEVVRGIMDDTNSVSAVLAGSLLTATVQCSLMHLMFLSLERFVAIKWPLWYKQRRTSTVLYTLVALWIISLLLCFIPAMLPDYFEYRFLPVIFVYMVAPKYSPNNTLGAHGPIFAMTGLLIPYLVTVVASFSAAYVVREKLKFPSISLRERISTRGGGSPVLPFRSGQISSGGSASPVEVVVLKTITLVVLAFSLTLVPEVVVLILYFVEYFDCDTYNIPYTIAFYISVFNSFVNVIIYTARDENFRDAILTVFLGKTRQRNKRRAELWANRRSPK